MPRSFDIPDFYRSRIASGLKRLWREFDAKKRNLTPALLDVGPVRFHLARHFGLCFGVENAIEIAYRAVEENKDKRVFLLSEMIHNPKVNQDLVERGIRFLQDTQGNELLPFEDLRAEDIVIVPAFGTSVEMFERLDALGVNARMYNTTCPFVEKVWRRAEDLGKKGFSVVIHGKHSHEETRATFSHARQFAPSIVVRDATEADLLCDCILGRMTEDQLRERLAGRMTDDFRPTEHLSRLGVVNQTTMLAEETHDISRRLRASLSDRFGAEHIAEHFADTRDTLCYATSENQRATKAMLETPADLALIVGGYNSSNTSHLYELCAERYPAYFIKDAGEILSERCIRHLELDHMRTTETSDWLPAKRPVDILVTAGASCPDALVDEVLCRVTELTSATRRLSDALEHFAELLRAQGGPDGGPSALEVIEN